MFRATRLTAYIIFLQTALCNEICSRPVRLATENAFEMEICAKWMIREPPIIDFEKHALRGYIMFQKSARKEKSWH
jgi:hypothetical protein